VLRVRLICAIKLVSLSLSYLIDSSTVKLTEAQSVRCHGPATVEGALMQSLPATNREVTLATLPEYYCDTVTMKHAVRMMSTDEITI